MKGRGVQKRRMTITRQLVLNIEKHKCVRLQLQLVCEGLMPHEVGKLAIPSWWLTVAERLGALGIQILLELAGVCWSESPIREGCFVICNLHWALY